ncbi:hypothetical protein [Amycolatopsis suaedae]|uniref:hypothetical protein n=1 Tax=Amycolatopsis suaedae TaxID=2510978 RepID=UPI0013EF1724|nr:hypothetical protein [Amycolatopsis suaedae]
MTVNPRDLTTDPASRYYVGPTQTWIPSGHQLRAEISARVGEQARGGWAESCLDDLLDSEVNQRYQETVEADSIRLADGLTLRDPGEPPFAHYDWMFHDDLDRLLNTDADPVAVSIQSEKWVEVGNALAGFQHTLAAAINRSEQEWRGPAGDAARAYTAGLARWVGEAGRGAQLAGNQQQIHSQALNEAQKQLADNPPVAFSLDDELNRLSEIDNPVTYWRSMNQVWQDYERAEAARERAVRVVTEFDATVATATTTPAFSPPPGVPGLAPPPTPPVVPPVTPPPVVPPPVVPPGTPPGTPPGSHPPRRPPGQWRDTRPGPGTGRFPQPAGPGDTTTPAGVRPDTGYRPARSTSDGPLPGTGRADPGAAAAGSWGAGRSGPGGGMPGGTSAGSGSGAGRAGGMGTGAGGLSRGLDGAGAARAGAAGGRGAGGQFGPFGGAPGAGGKGEEDKERKTPDYLIDERHAEVFLPDGTVTPETIGELKQPDREL